MTSNDGVATRTSTVASTSNIGNIMAFTDINKIIDEMNSKGVLTNNKEVMDEETAAAVDATVAVDAQEEGHEPESERGRRLVVDNNADSKNDDDDDNGTSTPEDDVMYYEDYPTLYFAIRRGRYTNNNSIVNINADADCGVGAGRICYNWDEAKHELHNYHSVEYIATPTLLQATRYIHRLGEFKNNHDNDNIDIDNEIDNVCEDSDNGANNNDNENDSNATAATTDDDDDDDDNDNNTVTISSSSSSSMVHHHRRSKSKKKKMGKKKRKKKKKDGSKKKESIDTTTTTAIIPTIKKTKELLMEFYKLYDPHDTATTTTATNMMTSDTGDGSGMHEKEEEHHNKNANKNKRRLSMDTFLQEKNMYERKYERMVRHWTRSGLVIMRNENVSIDVAFMKYDIWIEERQEEKIANTNTACRTTSQLLQDDDDDNDDQEKQTNEEREEEDHCDDDNNSDDDGSGRSPPRKKRKTSVAGLAQVATLFEKTSAAATTTIMANGDSDDDEAWDEMYRELKKFYQEHKHCKVDPMNDRIIQSKTESGVEKSLQCWVAYQHRRMQPQKEQRQGGAAKFLTIREERLLNKLEFIPNYDKITKHLNQYIRRRIAKAFPIPADYINPTTNVTRQIYFGTVDRIASITNQWVRIHFDDGDTEDFDIKCVTEGSKLYEEYKDIDPYPEGFESRTGSTNSSNDDQHPDSEDDNDDVDDKQEESNDDNNDDDDESIENDVDDDDIGERGRIKEGDDDNMTIDNDNDNDDDNHNEDESAESTTSDLDECGHKSDDTFVERESTTTTSTATVVDNCTSTTDTTNGDDMTKDDDDVDIDEEQESYNNSTNDGTDSDDMDA